MSAYLSNMQILLCFTSFENLKVVGSSSQYSVGFEVNKKYYKLWLESNGQYSPGAHNLV